MSKSAAMLGPVLALAFITVSCTPLKSAIGRTHPGWAASFSPVTFNFFQTYTSGKVQAFTVGMSRKAFIETLDHHYATSAFVTFSCVPQGGTMMPRADQLEALDRLQCDAVTLSFYPEERSLIFDFAHDQLGNLEASVANRELLWCDRS